MISTTSNSTNRPRCSFATLVTAYAPCVVLRYVRINPCFFQLAGPHMLSTQVQALVREYFADVGTPLRRTLRRDIIAVR